MKIERKQIDSVLFEDLEIGMTFTANSELVWMKIRPLVAIDGKVNAISLDGRTDNFFLDNSHVTPIHGRFVED